MRLRFTVQATQDLASIGDYLKERSPATALVVRSAILATLQTVLQFPQIGRRQTVEGVRKLVTRRYRYLIYYTIDQSSDEVVVLTIQHPAREREYVDR